ncbi:MAG: DUF5801 repeats-in-toxin domain-containing protein, partial [Candidatus Berkiella sp.]
AFSFVDDAPSIEVVGSPVIPELSVDESIFGLDTASFAGLFATVFGNDGFKDTDNDDTQDDDAITYVLSVGNAASGLIDTISQEAIELVMDGNDIIGRTEDGLDEVFRISVDVNTGEITLTQLRSIVHADGGDPNDVVGLPADAIVLTATAEDGDGDTDSASINIGSAFSFVDDAPVATDNSNSVNESLLLNGGAIVSGNLLTDDNGNGVDLFGADGGRILSINGVEDGSSGDLDAASGSITTQTSFDTGNGIVEGKLTVNTITGAYTFELIDASDVPDIELTTQHISTYTIVDGDGDTATGNLTIDIDLNQIPTVEDVIVNDNEDALSIPIILKGSDSDIGGSIASFNIPILPLNGTLYEADLITPIIAGTNYSATSNQLTLYFVPNANFNGTVSFDYGAIDNTGDSSVNETVTINIASVNDAPEGTDITVFTNEDTQYTFTAANFGFSDVSDSPANSLLAVRISSLPTAGTLTNNGIAVTVGSFVSVTDINAGLLKFTPATNANGTDYASFTFQVQDNGGTANAGVDLDPTPNTMTINVTSVNDAPSGSNATVVTNEDTQYTFTAANFGFSDVSDSPANSLLAVRISSLPTAGTLT